MGEEEGGRKEVIFKTLLLPPSTTDSRVTTHPRAQKQTSTPPFLDGNPFRLNDCARIEEVGGRKAGNESFKNHKSLWLLGSGRVGIGSKGKR